VSRAAWTALLGGLLLLAAAAFDTESLYVPGVALAAAGICAAGWVSLAVAGARVERVPGPHAVQEEEPWPLRVRVVAGIVPAPGGELLEPLLARPLPLAGRRSRSARIEVRFERRGRRSLAPARAVIRDPLGLAARELASGDATEVLVLPRIEPVEAAGGGAIGRLLGEALEGNGDGGRRATAAEVEVDSLRPYAPGAPASRIHWPTVARTGTMMERRLVAGAASRPLVVLDPRSPAGPEALDRAVRAAASLCFHLARAGGCGLLLPGDRRPLELGTDLRGFPAAHARLAVVEEADGAPAASGAQRTGAVVWVSAARPQVALAAIRRAGVPARYVVTPAGEGVRAAFRVAGCAGRPVAATARAAAA
jgi:uncharacterized protein (DUF58 family)